MSVSEIDLTEPRPAIPIGRILFSCSFGPALVAGVAVLGLAAMVVISVMGRWLFSSPIYGDFEMVAMGTAICVSLFLPYCQLMKGNVVVDLFLSWAPIGIQRFMDALAALLLGVIAAVFSWRLVLGTISLHEANEMTLILGIIPVLVSLPLL